SHDLPHLAMSSDHWNEPVDLRLADRARDFVARDLDPAFGVEGDRVLPCEPGERRAVVEPHSLLTSEPGQRAVHGPRVEMEEAEPASQCQGDSALAGACGSVDRDNHQAILTARGEEGLAQRALRRQALLSSELAEEREEAGKARLDDFGPDNLHALARREARDGAEHRQAMVAARVHPSATESGRNAPDAESVPRRADVRTQLAQLLDHPRDPVGLLRP